MKWIGPITFLLAAASLAQNPATQGQDRSEQIIQALDMRLVPRESGLRGVIGRIMPELATGKRPLAVESSHYTMLTRAVPMIYLHQFESTETSVLVEGGPVEWFIFCPTGHVDHQIVSRDYAATEEPLVMVPPGCWQAAQLKPGADYALMVTTLAPEWTSDRLRVGAGAAWIKTYAGKSEWATPELLRTIIGPNWQP